MKSFSKVLVLLAAVTLLATGCDKKKIPFGKGTPAKTRTTPALLNVLDGYWVGDCQAVDDVYERIEFSYDSKTMNMEIGTVTYSGGYDCDTGEAYTDPTSYLAGVYADAAGKYVLSFPEENVEYPFTLSGNRAVITGLGFTKKQ